MNDTIFSPATVPGISGIAVIRISGDAVSLCQSLILQKKLTPRLASLSKIYAKDQSVIDEALAIYFKAPRSFTGEDVLELHIHGGRAVMAAVLERIAEIPGCRLAEPGEFTRRSFYNGKMDLTAIEGLSDLIHAATEAQRKQALRQMQGKLGEIYADWRSRLIRCLAHYEAVIDFPDEGLDPGVESALKFEIQKLQEEVRSHLCDNRRGEILREGLRVAILGAPNAGKSSLLNALSRREAAIVSHHAGTTRDVITVSLDLSGFPLIVSDTAGIREAENDIEAEGIRRSIAEAEQSDARLIVLDVGHTDPKTGMIPYELRSYQNVDTILVLNKFDLLDDTGKTRIIEKARETGISFVAVSTKTSEGIKDLEDKLLDLAQNRMDFGHTPRITKLRHRKNLEDVMASITRFVVAPLPELAAEDLRLATRSLGQITGHVDVEEILDVVFADFCIGK